VLVDIYPDYSKARSSENNRKRKTNAPKTNDAYHRVSVANFLR
jgi:hypothetical protein